MEGDKSSVNIGDTCNIGDSSSSVSKRNSFRSAYDNIRIRIYMPVTPKIEDVYSKRVDKFGAITYEKTGIVNVYEEHQRYAEDTDIKVIISRMAKDGSLDLLSARPDQMVDVSDLPDDYIGLFNLGLALQEEFDKLSPEDRAAFNNSYINYADSRIKGTDKETVEKSRVVDNKDNGGDNNV